MPIVPQERTGISLDVPMAQVNPSQYGAEAAAIAQAGGAIAEVGSNLYVRIKEEEAQAVASDELTSSKQGLSRQLTEAVAASPDGYYHERVTNPDGSLSLRRTDRKLSEFYKDLSKNTFDTAMSRLPNNRAKELYRERMNPFLVESQTNAFNEELIKVNKSSELALDNRIASRGDGLLNFTASLYDYRDAVADTLLEISQQAVNQGYDATRAEAKKSEAQQHLALRTFQSRLNHIEKELPNIDGAAAVDNFLKELQGEDNVSRVMRATSNITPPGMVLDPDQKNRLIQQALNIKTTKSELAFSDLTSALDDSLVAIQSGNDAAALQRHGDFSRMLPKYLKQNPDKAQALIREMAPVEFMIRMASLGVGKTAGRSLEEDLAILNKEKAAILKTSGNIGTKEVEEGYSRFVKLLQERDAERKAGDWAKADIETTGGKSVVAEINNKTILAPATVESLDWAQAMQYAKSVSAKDGSSNNVALLQKPAAQKIKEYFEAPSTRPEDIRNFIGKMSEGLRDDYYAQATRVFELGQIPKGMVYGTFFPKLLDSDMFVSFALLGDKTSLNHEIERYNSQKSALGMPAQEALKLARGQDNKIYNYALAISNKYNKNSKIRTELVGEIMSFMDTYALYAANESKGGMNVKQAYTEVLGALDSVGHLIGADRGKFKAPSILEARSKSGIEYTQNDAKAVATFQQLFENEELLKKFVDPYNRTNDYLKGKEYEFMANMGTWVPDDTNDYLVYQIKNKKGQVDYATKNGQLVKIPIKVKKAGDVHNTVHDYLRIFEEEEAKRSEERIKKLKENLNPTTLINKGIAGAMLGLKEILE